MQEVGQIQWRTMHASLELCHQAPEVPFFFCWQLGMREGSGCIQVWQASNGGERWKHRGERQGSRYHRFTWTSWSYSSKRRDRPAAGRTAQNGEEVKMPSWSQVWPLPGGCWGAGRQQRNSERFLCFWASTAKAVWHLHCSWTPKYFGLLKEAAWEHWCLYPASVPVLFRMREKDPLGLRTHKWANSSHFPFQGHFEGLSLTGSSMFW